MLAANRVVTDETSARKMMMMFRVFIADSGPRSAPAICLMNLVRPDYMPTAWQLRAVECSLSCGKLSKCMWKGGAR